MQKSASARKVRRQTAAAGHGVRGVSVACIGLGASQPPSLGTHGNRVAPTPSSRRRAPSDRRLLQQNLPGAAVVQRSPNKGWQPRPIKAGEFFLGYPDEDGPLTRLPQPETLSRNGTFMAYRRLQEHVGAFREFLRQHGETAEEQELVAAKLMGRWRSGAPLVLAPERERSRCRSRTATACGQRCSKAPNGSLLCQWPTTPTGAAGCME